MYGAVKKRPDREDQAFGNIRRSKSDSLIIVDPKKLLNGIKDSKYRRDKILVAALKAVMADFKYELKEKTLKVVMRHY